MAAELHLDAGAHLNDTDYFLDLAQNYRDQFGSARLSALIRERFFCGDCGARPGLAHYWLMSMPLRYIVTTNYDDLLEIAGEGLRRLTTTVRGESDVADAAGSGQHVIKIHGDARDEMPEVILSRDDYDEFFHRHPAMAALLEGLLLNQTFLFLGYGLRDVNFRQIYNRIAIMLREAKRPAYATLLEEASTSSAASLSAASWQRKKLLPIVLRDERDLWDFLDSLAETAQGHDRLFLSPDVHDEAQSSSPTFAALKRSLNGVAAATMAAAHEKLSPDEAEQTARVLSFLIDCGWRPASMNARNEDARLAAREALAQSVQNPQIARGILLEAMAHARSDDDVQRLKLQIQNLDAQGHSE